MEIVTEKSKKRKRWENPRHVEVREAIGLLINYNCMSVVLAYLILEPLDEPLWEPRPGCAACVMKLPGHRPCRQTIRAPKTPKAKEEEYTCEDCQDKGCYYCGKGSSTCYVCRGPIRGERRGNWSKCVNCDPFGYYEYHWRWEYHIDDCEGWNCLGWCYEDYCDDLVNPCAGPCQGGHKDKYF